MPPFSKCCHNSE